MADGFGNLPFGEGTYAGGLPPSGPKTWSLSASPTINLTAPLTHLERTIFPSASPSIVLSKTTADANFVGVPSASPTLEIGDSNSLELDGAGDYALVPDHATLDVTGDLTIVAKVAADDWITGQEVQVIHKTSAAGNYAYTLNLTAAGNLKLYWSEDGTAILSRTSSTTPPATNGEALWIAAELDVSTGTGKFYTGGSGDTPSWAQLGTDVTGSATSIFAGNTNLGIGNSVSGGVGLDGRVYHARIYDGLAITNPDPNTKYLDLDASAGTYASVPDHSSLDVTGDLTIVAKVALDDWTPAAITCIVGKWTTGNESYLLRVNATSGTLRLDWNDGVTNLAHSSSVAPTVSDGEALWVAAELDADDGASGRVVKFYTGGSGDQPAWTQLGATRTGADTTINSAAGTLFVGAYDAGANPLDGRVYHARVYDGLAITDAANATAALDIDFTAQALGATSFTERSPNSHTVTLNGNALLAQNLRLDADFVHQPTGTTPFTDETGIHTVSFNGNARIRSPYVATGVYVPTTSATIVLNKAASHITGSRPPARLTFFNRSIDAKDPVEMKFPFQIDATGGVAFISDPEVIYAQHLRYLILTGLTERPMFPNYGTSVRSRVFEPDDAALTGVVMSEVQAAVERWEPGVRIHNIAQVRDDHDDGMAQFVVQYSVSASLEQDADIRTAFIEVGGEVTETHA